MSERHVRAVKEAEQDRKRAAHKAEKAREHAARAHTASLAILAAIDTGQPIKHADALVLEAAGCYIRRNAAQR